MSKRPLSFIAKTANHFRLQHQVVISPISCNRLPDRKAAHVVPGLRRANSCAATEGSGKSGWRSHRPASPHPAGCEILPVPSPKVAANLAGGPTAPLTPQIAATGMEMVEEDSGRDCSARQITPPGPMGIFSLSRVWKCRTSFVPGEALFLNSRG